MAKTDLSGNLRAALRKKKVLIANHRGTFGGGIIENTIDAFNLALAAGADIVELDIVRSKDGVYYVYHDTEEMRTLGFADNVHAFTAGEIDAMTYVNRYGFKTSVHIDRFESVLHALKGRCFINLDRCAKYGFSYLEDALNIIKRQDMFEQLLVKTVANDALLAGIEKYAVPFMYMPIAYNVRDVENVLARKNINTVALELLFDSDAHPLVSAQNVCAWRERGLALWANTIVIDDKYVMSGGHTDTVALTQDKQAGWGALIDKGFTILQTDWPYFLREYLKKKLGETT